MTSTLIRDEGNEHSNQTHGEQYAGRCTDTQMSYRIDRTNDKCALKMFFASMRNIIHFHYGVRSPFSGFCFYGIYLSLYFVCANLRLHKIAGKAHVEISHRLIIAADRHRGVRCVSNLCANIFMNCLCVHFNSINGTLNARNLLGNATAETSTKSFSINFLWAKMWKITLPLRFGFPLLEFTFFFRSHF